MCYNSVNVCVEPLRVSGAGSISLCHGILTYWYYVNYCMHFNCGLESFYLGYWNIGSGYIYGPLFFLALLSQLPLGQYPTLDKIMCVFAASVLL